MIMQMKNVCKGILFCYVKISGINLSISILQMLASSTVSLFSNFMSHICTTVSNFFYLLYSASNCQTVEILSNIFIQIPKKHFATICIIQIYRCRLTISFPEVVIPAEKLTLMLQK